LGAEYVLAEVTERRATAMGRTNAPMKAVILVGGEGTRLRPLTYDTPKPMVPVLNRPFLEHTIAHLKKCWVNNIILAVSYLPEVVQDYFDDGSNLGVRLTYAIESSPLGTAGAVKNAERSLDATFAVLNGDIFSGLDVAEMLDFHRSKRAKATIALTRVHNPCAFGVVEADSDGRIRQFIEKPSPNQVTTNWINAGVYILEPEVLEHVPPSSHYMFERGLFPLLLEQGDPIYCYPFSSGYWLDMGTPEKYLQLNCDLLLAKADSFLIDSLGSDAVRIEESATIHSSAEIVGPAIIGSNCCISRGVRIRDSVVIGPDCYIGEDAILEEAVLWKGANIGRGATLKRCVVGCNTTIGDGARVTDRAVVGDHIRIVSEERLELPAIPDGMVVEDAPSPTGLLPLPQASMLVKSSPQGAQFENNSFRQRG
jgi:mannose-1-phosphate guanylyltransferase